MEEFDVVVIGTGNAGFAAALAAAERGRSVVMLERGGPEQIGGNSYFTAGATRIAHDGLESLSEVIDDDPRLDRTEVPAYSEAEYLEDLRRLTDGRSDPRLGAVLAGEGLAAMRWQHGLGLRFRLMYERQAYVGDDGRYRFWGGLHIGNTGGGKGMIDDYRSIAAEFGISVRPGHDVVGLLGDIDGVCGVEASVDGGRMRVEARSVIIASGSFEASAERRARYLGEAWTNAIVRGTPHNTGDVLELALALGAGRAGDWGTAHSVQWDAYAEHSSGNLELTNRFTRQSYPLGILVDAEGRRFADEGEDFRNYTYAKLGRAVLGRPGGVAFQIFDARLRPMLRPEEYEMPGVSHAAADTVAELADRIGVPGDELERTIDRFNAGIDRSRPFDPTIRDGRASSAQPPKSNWANPIEQAPFHAYPVKCGITFAFGGLKTDTHGRVLAPDGGAIPGLMAAGEALGGLFSRNYPGGSGLAAGSVFGSRAGSVA